MIGIGFVELLILAALGAAAVSAAILVIVVFAVRRSDRDRDEV